MNNKIWYVVVRQPEGEEEYFDYSTMAGTAHFARNRAVENEKTIAKSYWDANPATGIARIEMVERERLEW